jgi:hypothetical protein
MPRADYNKFLKLLKDKYFVRKVSKGDDMAVPTGYISDESNCSYDDLWNKVNTRVHLQENCDEWNHLNVLVLLKPEEETLKTLMNEFFGNKNSNVFVELMQELDCQGWI